MRLAGGGDWNLIHRTRKNGRCPYLSLFIYLSSISLSLDGRGRGEGEISLKNGRCPYYCKKVACPLFLWSPPERGCVITPFVIASDRRERGNLVDKKRLLRHFTPHNDNCDTASKGRRRFVGIDSICAPTKPTRT